MRTVRSPGRQFIDYHQVFEQLIVGQRGLTVNTGRVIDGLMLGKAGGVERISFEVPSEASRGHGCR